MSLRNKINEQFNIALKSKNNVFPKIKDGIFCWHEAWRQTKIYCGMTLGQSIFPGWFYLFDLRQDPEKILAIAKDIQALTKSISAPKSYIRTLKSNRAPIIMPAHYSQYERVRKKSPGPSCPAASWRTAWRNPIGTAIHSSCCWRSTIRKLISTSRRR